MIIFTVCEDILFTLKQDVFLYMVDPAMVQITGMSSMRYGMPIQLQTNHTLN